MKVPIVGWDVGGANIKAVRVGGHIDSDGPAESAVIQRPFPLWREADRLPAVLLEMAGDLRFADRECEMAVTMTAELADCFATKRDGVLFVLDAFGTAFPHVEIRVFGVDGMFRSVLAAREDPLEVAAANWMASAALVARMFADAILLDVGSTTTDVTPIVGGRVVARGRTDTERLARGELIYTGMLRTPLCAILQSVSLGGRRCRVAAEHFAVAADAHLWTGRIEESDYTCDTPDGRNRSRSECGARLARMVCADAETLGVDGITAIAEQALRAQVLDIAQGIREVRKSLGPRAPSMAVLAGKGTFLAGAAADRTNLTICDLADHMGSAAAGAGPAAGVAYLLADSISDTPGLEGPLRS